MSSPNIYVKNITSIVRTSYISVVGPLVLIKYKKIKKVENAIWLNAVFV